VEVIFLGCKGHDVCRMSSFRIIILFSADEICEFSTGYIQVAESPTITSMLASQCLWIRCLYGDKLRRNEAYPHKLVALWMRMLLTFSISYISDS
jgi:hypothetical protein